MFFFTSGRWLALDTVSRSYSHLELEVSSSISRQPGSLNLVKKINRCKVVLTARKQRKENSRPPVARVSIRARTWAESYKNTGLHLRPPLSSSSSSLLPPDSETRDAQPRKGRGTRRAEGRRTREGPESAIEGGGCRRKPARRHHEARLEEVVVVRSDRQRW